MNDVLQAEVHFAQFFIRRGLERAHSANVYAVALHEKYLHIVHGGIVVGGLGAVCTLVVFEVVIRDVDAEHVACLKQ